VLGPDHPNTHGSLANVATAVQLQGRISEALALYLETVESYKRTLGPNHPDTLNVERNLATALGEQKRYSEAEKIFRRAFEKRQQLFGPDHHQVIDDLCDLAITLSHMGRHAEAGRIFQDTLERAEQSEGKQTRPAAYFGYASGSVLAGRRQQGLELLEKSVDLGLDPLVYDLTKVDDLETLRGDSRFEKLVARMRLERDKAAAK
jgi:tetratricopeptide (TPR) repeat protein